MSADTPIIHPEVRKLSEQNEQLRAELVHIIAEEYELKHKVAPLLQATYQIEFGDLEIALLKAQIQVAKLRRTLELAQSALNQGKPPNWVEINEQIKREELVWQEKIAEAMRLFHQATFQMDHRLSPEDSDELRKLYRALVKKLHPDLNPNLSERHKELWLSVQHAYAASDLEALRLYASIADNLAEGTPPAAPMALDLLRSEQEKLLQRINDLRERLKNLRASEPFASGDLLDDPAWVAAKRADIQTKINLANGQEKLLESLLQPLLATAHGTLFGPN